MDNTDHKRALWENIVLQDNMSSFESLFHLLNKRLIQFCMLYVHQVEIAEEIVADIFVKCWEARKSLAGINNIESYLFIAVKNHSINYIKKYSNIRWNQLQDGNKYDLADLFDPQKSLELKELSFKMEQAIQSLPLQARLIFRLVKEYGMKYKEVAEILDISPKTVHTQLYRTIKKLGIVFNAYRTNSVKIICIAILLAGAAQLFFNPL